MNKPYTYIIIYNNTGEFYIGSRSANRTLAVDDLWHTYFTSSKIVNERIKSEGTDCFTAQVINEFDTPEEAFVAEQLMISERINDPLCLNKTYQLNGKQVFLTTGTKRPFTSPETRQKISEALKGRNTYKRSDQQLSILKEHSFSKGSDPWNKGTTYKHTAPSPHKGRVSPNKGRTYDGEALSNIQSAAKSADRRAKISEAIKGRTSPTKGMSFPKTECLCCGRLVANHLSHRHKC